MVDPIPFILYGDGPRLPSGLGRIARDLLLRLLPEEETLGIVVHQVGVDPPVGWHWRGWPFWGFQPDAHDQGRSALIEVLEELQTQYTMTPIVLMIMDPSRCYDLTRQIDDFGGKEVLAARFWGYFPIDSENVHGRIGGPAAEAIWSCERVLGYGQYGARVVQATLQWAAQQRLGTQTPADRVQVPTVPYLPHGLDPHFHPGTPLEASGPGFAEWRTELPGQAWILGCVATNQPRKDLSLLFASAAVLKRQGATIGVWLHTDRLTNAWDVGQLCLDFGLQRAEVCVSTGEIILTDLQLAARYAASDATLGVGLGEGFGYPLVESLACGTPAVHVDFAGGAELIPHPGWRLAPVAWRLESAYAVKRPVLNPADVAGALAVAAGWKRTEPALCQAYCSGAVAHLAWSTLWPRWRSWIHRGLVPPKEVRRGQRIAAQSV